MELVCVVHVSVFQRIDGRSVFLVHGGGDGVESLRRVVRGGVGPEVGREEGREGRVSLSSRTREGKEREREGVSSTDLSKRPPPPNLAVGGEGIPLEPELLSHCC